MVQFRDKSGDQAWRVRTAGEIHALCREHGVPLIINDDAQLAADIGAEGVHLGRDDGSISQAREVLGDDAIIGVSCYNRIGLAKTAAQNGADYLAFGSVYQSGSKPGAVHCPLPLLGEARSLGLPVVAIGGITPDNGRAVIEAGADSLAVIGAVFEAPGILEAASAFSAIWNQ